MHARAYPRISGEPGATDRTERRTGTLSALLTGRAIMSSSLKRSRAQRQGASAAAASLTLAQVCLCHAADRRACLLHTGL